VGRFQHHVLAALLAVALALGDQAPAAHLLERFRQTWHYDSPKLSQHFGPLLRFRDWQPLPVLLPL
jgi:hypothetical protein